VTELMTEPAAAGRDAQPIWRAPRRPVVVAAVVIAFATAALWGLRWWGPVNPELSLSSDGYDVEAGTARLVVENRSRSWVTLESATLGRFDRRATTELAEPLAVAPSSTAAFDATLPDCSGIASGSSTVDAVVTTRSAAGRTTDIGSLLGVVECPSRLPLPGEQPPDVEAARRGVTEAFWTVYDSDRTPADRLAAIHDPRDIEQLSTVVAAGPAGAAMGASKSGVTEIVFDRPDHAWVEYDVVSTSLGPGRTTIGGIGPGEAVLVDGRWKVTRGTVCNDLALASVRCPG
jgi:hypothetical protein